MQLKDMKLVVIGCSGLSGNFFIERLARENYKKKIKCLTRMSSDVEHLKKYDLNLEFRLVNFEDDEALRKELLGSNTVLNIAGIYLSEKIIHAGLAAGVQWFVCVHTAARYSNFESRKKNYIAIEDNLLKKNANITILRPTMIYGNQRDKNMHKLINFVDKYSFFPIFGHGQSLMSPIHAEDLGNAYFDVLSNSNATFGKQYDLSGSTNIAYVDLVKMTAGYLGKQIYLIYVPIWLSLMLVYIANFLTKSRFPVTVEQVQRLTENKVVDWTDAQKDFNFSPMAFSDGIKKQIDLVKPDKTQH